MSIKDRIRELTERVDRIERAVISEDAETFAKYMADKIYEKVIYGDHIEIKCPRFEVNINSDPEIIGNVMRWKGKDYLRFDFIPPTSGTWPILELVAGERWVPMKNFDGTDNIPITDELACMRTKEQPIWVVVKYERNKSSATLLKLVAVCDTYFKYKAINNDNIVDGYRFCRLANIDDLKKAGIR